MKKVSNIRFFVVLVLSLVSCDSGFDEMNTSKTSPLEIDPAFQLNNAVVNLSFPGNSLVYEVGIVQQMVTPNSGVLNGANFNQDNRDATQTLWQNYYRNVIRNTRDVIARTASEPERVNLYQMARIIQAYAFMVLTDSYGDIPYTAAGKGYLEGELFPAYDDQETVYNGIITELTEASQGLSEGSRLESGDIVYGGNILSWRKFANSLLLRAGMRLVKVDAQRASQIVQSVAAAPLILDNTDNAMVRHDANYTNLVSQPLNGSEVSNYYLTEPFVNYMKSTNDPRLASIAVRYKGATAGPDQKPEVATRDPQEQIGMPLGHNNATVATAATALGLASFYEFSQLDRTRMAKLTAPVFLVTAAQTNLLLAEARHRGWITTGTSEEYYLNGIRAHMRQLSIHDANSAVPQEAIEEYITTHPFDETIALEQINTQYWIASFLNGPEAFANFRRSGFPLLAPNPFPGKGIKGDFIRRLTYPNSEISVNSANVNDAIARMGADDLDTRVWWDVL